MDGDGSAMPADPFANSAVVQVMNALDAAMVFDLTAAYKAKMIEVGFSEDAAEQMAVDYHRTLVAE